MKYLKKFNEELKPGTYFSAARKLKKLGHTDRASELEDWGYNVESRENLVKWRDNLQDYSPFGLFKVKISGKKGQQLVGDFALFIQFDELAFEDSYEYLRQENGDNIKGLSIPMFIGVVPTSEDLISKCEEVMPEPEFGNGFYWGMFASIGFDIVNGKLVFTNFGLDSYDTGMSGNVSFADRSSAGRFKMLLKNIFTNPDLNYPSGYTDQTNFYKKLEEVVLAGAGLSVDYGVDLSTFADYIMTISPNTLYKA
jgi:hypothetical protein